MSDTGQPSPSMQARPDSDADSYDSRDAAAFRVLFERHCEELYRFAYRHVWSHETARDVVQEAFLCLWRRRGQVDIAGPGVRSYLYTTVRRAALDALRHWRVEERWRIELLMRDDFGLAADPHEEFTANEMTTTLQKAVEGLPKRQREIMLLRWEQRASYLQIAQRLGISPKTVAVHISRAMQQLRLALWPSLE